MYTDYYLQLEYQDGGRGPRFDCMGLVIHAFWRELGVVLPEYTQVSYETSEATDIESFIKSEARHWTPVEQIQPFDVVLLYAEGHVQHVGIAVNADEMMHLRRGCNVAIEPIYGATWGNSVYGIYRHVDMA